MPFFSSIFKHKDGSRSAKAGKNGINDANGKDAQVKPRWEESWSRKDVAPEEIQELIHMCTQEMKTKALDMPFLLLPFRPTSDPSAARNFVRNFFKSSYDGTRQFTGEGLQQELRLAEPLVLCSIMKWCWSRLPGGVVTWDAYELFRIGESDSNFAKHAFDTFIPLSVDAEARKQIIFDFFDLLAAVAARGKTNGMGGRKLSRMAGWWAFEHSDDGKGFDGGYKSWERAADATSHLFFAYLRSLYSDSEAQSGISALPRSLRALLSQTEYPPQTPLLMQTTTTKVVMMVDSVSPTPFALLRRAKQFEYRDDDEALQRFSAYEDTVRALTEECRRVLECISSANQSSSVLLQAGGTQDPSWSRFEDLGFSAMGDSSDASSTNGMFNTGGARDFASLRSGPRTRNTDFGRPTTPSWADFLSSGFADENNQTTSGSLLLPSQKLPPIGEATRVQSSQSHMRHGGLQTDEDLEPGELASISKFDLDDTFWWVWMTSLAGEETTERKAAFGRCTLVETKIPGAKWLLIEEQVKGASLGPEEGAYIAEKKGRFSFTKRGRLGRRKSTGKKPAAKDPYNRTTSNTPTSKTSIGPDQHARIQVAAAQLNQIQRDQKALEETAQRRARMDDSSSIKTNSVLSLGPHLVSEAGPAMKWDKKFGEGAKNRNALRAQYLGDMTAGKGSKENLLAIANGGTPSASRKWSNRDLPSVPNPEADAQSAKRNATPSPGPQPSTPTAGALKSPGAGVSSATPGSLRDNSPLPPPLVDDKPDPQSGYLDQHPALRKSVPERKPMADITSQVRPSEEQASASESQSTKISPPKKLKKKDGGGGFRKLFGKKKADAPIAAGHAQPEDVTEIPSMPEESEAARSASQADHHHSPAREPPTQHSAEKQEPVRALSPDVQPSPAVSAVSRDYREPPREAPDITEEQNAVEPASQFGQGPIVDMPAFVPDYSDDDDVQTALNASHYGSEEQDAVTPPRPETIRDDMSEESLELTEQASPSHDRWAQIRKNAADRATRLSEEQTRRSRSQSQSQSARTDEGETSGEETIESRVARIKARVAELTGNVEGGQGQPAVGRR